MEILLRGVGLMRGGADPFGPVDLSLGGQGTTVVLGPNGAGKTTLLRLIYGLDHPTSGQIALSRDLRKSYVFQSPTMLRRNVLANAAYPLVVAGTPRQRAQRKARKALEAAGLGDKLHQAARALSGGERQKLALVRAMITDPELLLLDEPTANLDGRSTKAIETTLAAALAAGTRVIMATHDLGQARRLADDIVFMAGGQICEHAPAKAFFAQPVTAMGQAFLRGDIVE